MGAEITMIIHDDSAVTDLEDFHTRKRELEARAITRAAVLHAAWRPMLAGAVGAALVVAAVYVTLPKFSVREIEVPKVSYREVEIPRVKMVETEVPHIVTRDIEIPIPRIVEPQPLARTPAEERFTSTDSWKDAIIRGRILRQDGNGFVLMTDEAGEQGFYPARINAAGKPELDPSAEDIVAPYIGDLARCNKLPVGTFACVAEHEGQEVFIRQTPIKGPPAG